MKTYRLPNGVRYRVQRDKVVTTFPDGSSQDGVPSFDDESVARARELGYRGSNREVVRAMTADHDLLHSIVALNIDGGESHALRWSRDGVTIRGRIPLEERLVFLVTRAINQGRGVLDEFAM